MKKIATILTFALLLASTAAQAQIYLMDGEDNTYRDPDVESWVVNPATYNEGTDSYAPTGSGIALLAVLGGAYLLSKKRKK